MGEIIIEKSNTRALVMTMASLFLLMASVAIAIYGFMKDKLRLWLPGIFGIIIFIVTLDMALKEVRKVKSLITITLDGIIDNSSISGIGFISFDDIAEFRIESIYDATVIAVGIKDINSFMYRLPVVKRRQIKRNIYMKQPPVFINVDMAKDMEPEDILTMLLKRLSDYNSLYEY